MKYPIIIFVGIIILITISFLFSKNTPTPTTAVSERTFTLNIPPQLLNQFPNTDFSKSDSVIEGAISGGPAKDGIPAIDNPRFVPLQTVTYTDDVQAIVMATGEEAKVYPYNILTWHEIVNDDVGGTPVAITFCPLCGSAIVFNRTLPNGTISTFGVSGSLLESNMIMFDRATESLWQQSTGDSLAGSLHPYQLALEPFQLLTLGEVRGLYPNALVLSEDTGHVRDYRRNPYAGYETNDQFVFDVSGVDATFPPKTIMAVFRDSARTYATPWLALREQGTLTYNASETTFTLTVTDSGELTITDSGGTNYPFYFEMWFSTALQHPDVVVIN